MRKFLVFIITTILFGTIGFAQQGQQPPADGSERITSMKALHKTFKVNGKDTAVWLVEITKVQYLAAPNEADALEFIKNNSIQAIAAAEKSLDEREKEAEALSTQIEEITGRPLRELFPEFATRLQADWEIFTGDNKSLGTFKFRPSGKITPVGSNEEKGEWVILSGKRVKITLKEGKVESVLSFNEEKNTFSVKRGIDISLKKK